MFGTAFSRFSSFFWQRGYIFLAALGAAILWGSNSLLQSLLGMKLERGSSVIVAQTLGIFDNPNPIWLPSRWAADVVNCSFSSAAPDLKLEMFLLTATAFGMTAAAFLVFDQLFFPVRSAAAAHRRIEEDESLRTKNPNTPRADHSDLVHRTIDRLYELLGTDQQRKAIIVKDICCLLRDRGQALQMLFYLGFVAIYSVLFRFMNAAFALPGFYTQLSARKQRTLVVGLPGRSSER